MKKREEFFSRLKYARYAGMYLSFLPNVFGDILFIENDFSYPYNPIKVLTEEEMKQVYSPMRYSPYSESIEEIMSSTLTIEGLVNLTQILKKPITFFSMNKKKSHSTEYSSISQLHYKPEGLSIDEIESIKIKLNDELGQTEILLLDGSLANIKKISSFDSLAKLKSKDI